ncbi:MAG: hypothetical protein HYX89_05020 [Chloroflexi bacterium]|nr:hypothetical protein [Chloroflexota bacterium]
MDPRTEYVMIYDVDFIPPPDAIWSFLEYFIGNGNGKNGNGNGNGNGKNGNGNGSVDKRVAAVQGYQ